MLSCTFFTWISSTITSAKSLAGVGGVDQLFGGVSIILIGDFHWFPPVTGHPLYWPTDSAKDNAEEVIRHAMYEQFNTVVHLTQQV